MAASPTNLRLWEDLDGNSSAPTGAPKKAGQTEAFQLELPRGWDKAHLVITNSAGTNPSIKARLWVYHSAAAVWLPFGVGYGAAAAVDPTTAGYVNGNTAITEAVSGGDNVRHVEPISGLGGFAGIYLQATDIAGTPTFDAWLVRAREDR